jgi:multiple sugar transport system substrate-binding protein
MRFGRNARVAALFAAMALILTACPDDEVADPDEPVELVWAVGGAEAQPGGIHQRNVELWNEQNDHIQVRIETLPEDADEQRVQQSLVLDAGAPDFDILGMDVIWTGEYSENEWVLSLEDIRGEIEGNTLQGPFESALWGGELWAAPYNSNAGFLYYRTDLVDEPPTTWEELMEVGLQAAEEEGIAAFVGQGARYEGFVVNYLEYFWSAGGELYNEDQTEALFAEGDAAMTAVEFMHDSLQEGFYAPGFNTAMEEEARSEFQGGNAVFMRNWPYAYGLIQDDEDSPVRETFDIAPLPTFDGDGTISALGGFNNGVSAFSDHPEQAIEFVLWLSTNEEVQRFLGERALPPTLEVVYEELAEDPVMALLGEVLPDARARPPAPEYTELSDTIQREMYPAYNGDQDFQQAIDGVQTFLEGTTR